MMRAKSDPDVVLNTVYHKTNEIEVRKAKDMGFDVGFGVIHKDNTNHYNKIPEAYGIIKAYQLTWTNYLPSA